MVRQTGNAECGRELEALIESEERFRLLFEHAPIGMVLADLQGKFQRVNQAMCDLVGYQADELCNLRFQDITHTDDRDNDLPMMEKLIKGDIPRFAVEKRYLRRDRQILYVMLYVSLRFYQDGSPAYFIGQIVDITERKRYEEAMRHMAYHDPLTGLPNRTLFRDKLIVALAQVCAQQGCLAVIFLDLDRFKTINDTLGHYMGDQALKIIADRLAAVVRKSDLVARLGGDEFTILLPNLADEKDIHTVLQKIMETLESPLYLEGKAFVITASIGIALYPADGNDVDALLQAADKAMYQDKQKRGIPVD
jgi:diguanylate cyclase (GGDEF)-like protein/PAS domain S-box-containing protein